MLRLFQDRLVLEAVPEGKTDRLKRFCRKLAELLGMKTVPDLLPWLHDWLPKVGPMAAAGAALAELKARLHGQSELVTLSIGTLPPLYAKHWLNRYWGSEFSRNMSVAEFLAGQDARNLQGHVATSVVLVFSQKCLEQMKSQPTSVLAELEALQQREPEVNVVGLDEENVPVIKITLATLSRFVETHLEKEVSVPVKDDQDHETHEPM